MPVSEHKLTFRENGLRIEGDTQNAGTALDWSASIIGVFAAGMNDSNDFNIDVGNPVEHQIVGVDNHLAHTGYTFAAAIEIRVFRERDYGILNTLF